MLEFNMNYVLLVNIAILNMQIYLWLIITTP